MSPQYFAPVGLGTPRSLGTPQPLGMPQSLGMPQPLNNPNPVQITPPAYSQPAVPPQSVAIPLASLPNLPVITFPTGLGITTIPQMIYPPLPSQGSGGSPNAAYASGLGGFGDAPASAFTMIGD